jgi:NOL1/NOP2/fmu family ribosome biogenesis protein|tara:strand:- start:25 stop:477 length:453 start_codon:yes stop_codon:yes gene_type:complete
MKVAVLERKERKEFLKLLESQFGFTLKLDFAFFKTEKGKIYGVNRDVGLLDLSNVRVNSLGVYLGEVSHGEARLSIEGSQVIGVAATKGVVTVSDSVARMWIKGNDIETDTTETGFVLIKNSSDFLGCGRVKEGVILNFVPKTRYLQVSD